MPGASKRTLGSSGYDHKPVSLVVQQFGSPSGLLGEIVGWVLAAKNKRRSLWVLSLLDLQPQDRVLEIGFGPGMDIRRVVERVADGSVAGVDHSATMVRQATRRNKRAIRRGQVDLREGSASKLPFPDGYFDKIFAINVAQFWDDVDACANELRRVLAPSGLVAVAVQPRSKGTTESEILEVGAGLARALAFAGFSEVQEEFGPAKPATAVCLLAMCSTAMRRNDAI